MMDEIDWYSISDHELRIEATQIPINLLNQMTTDQLVNAVLHYPLMMDLLHFDSYRDGFEVVKNNFNGLQELLMREDGAQKLYERYQQTPIATYSAKNTEMGHMNEIIMHPWYLEIVLAQLEALEQFSDTELNDIAAEAEEKLELKNSSDLYGTSKVAFYEAVAENSGVSTYDYYTNIYTPRGSSVYCNRRTYELSGSEIGTMDANDSRTYPQARRLRGSTRYYNCFSYAFYEQGANNVYWIESKDEMSKFYTDGSFYEVQTPRVGDRAVYPNRNHAAIVTSIKNGVTGNVVSKWGMSGLYEHDLSYGPYSPYMNYSFATTFYRQ